MTTKFWIAFGMSANGTVQQNMVSKSYEHLGDAMNWARQKLADHHATDKVAICQAEFLATRVSPPVDIARLTPADNDNEGTANEGPRIGF